MSKPAKKLKIYIFKTIVRNLTKLKKVIFYFKLGMTKRQK